MSTCTVAIDTDRYTDSLNGNASATYAAQIKIQIDSGYLDISDALDAAYGADEMENRLTEFAGDIVSSDKPAEVKAAFVQKTIDKLVERFEESGLDIG